MRSFTLIGIVLIGVMATYGVWRHFNSLVKNHAAVELKVELEDAAAVVERHLESDLDAVHAFGGYLTNRPFPPAVGEFERYAADSLARAHNVIALQVVDSTWIIRQTYPAAGHEDAMGLDLHSRPAAPYVERAITERRLVVAPPFKTVQGKVAIFARRPLFHGDDFFGLAAGLIDTAKLNQALREHFGERFEWQLVDAHNSVIAQAGAPTSDWLTLPFTVEGDTWHLKAGWRQPITMPGRLTTLIVAIGGALTLAVMVIVASVWQRHTGLEEKVETRTRELAERNEQLDDALREARHLSAFLEQLVDSSLFCIIVTEEDGTVSFWNRGAARITGYTQAEVVAEDDIWHQLYPDQEYLEKIESKMRAALARGSGLEGFESRLRDKAGDTHEMMWSVTSLEDDGAHGRILAIGIDTTLQQKTLAQLRESEERFRTTFEKVTVGMAHTALDGTFVRINQVFADKLGYAHEDLLGMSVADITHPEECDRDLGAIRQMLAGEVDSYRTEKRYLRRDGSIMWGDMMTSILRDKAGEPLYFITAVIDITERKEQEFELFKARSDLQEVIGQLKSTQQQIVQQERMQALGAMSSGIAHDFNNSLSVITGFTDLLVNKLGDVAGDREQSYLERIRTAAGDAAHTVSRLREFYRSKEDDDARQMIRLGELIEETILLTEPRWKRQAQARSQTIQVRAEVPDPTLQIYANASELREMLTNLVINAVDAMEDEGTVTIGARALAAEVEVSVQDTGKGMTPDVLKQCMEPFFTTKGNKGTGLGLAMVHGIMERHGGRMNVDSQPGEGTVITLRFPRDNGAPGEDGALEAVSTVVGLHILVVDDEPAIREMMEELLILLGHKVSLAADGLEALRCFRGDRFDLVITDRAMPKLGGDELASKVRELDGAVPIIMLSGFGSLMQHTDEVPEGVDLVLGKPIFRDHLERAIGAVMDQAR